MALIFIHSTQLGWSILDNEALAVLITFNRMHWIVENPEGFYF